MSVESRLTMSTAAEQAATIASAAGPSESTNSPPVVASKTIRWGRDQLSRSILL